MDSTVSKNFFFQDPLGIGSIFHFLVKGIENLNIPDNNPLLNDLPATNVPKRTAIHPLLAGVDTVIRNKGVEGVSPVLDDLKRVDFYRNL